MISKKLIIWMASIVITIGVILISLQLLYIIHKVTSSVFIVIIGIEVILIIVGTINIAFGFDNPAFLQSYDNIKALEKQTKAKLEAVEGYTQIMGKHEIIGRHEARRLYGAAVEIPKEKLDGIVRDVVKDIDSGVSKGEDWIDEKIKAVRAGAIAVQEDIKQEVDKIETPIKEIFEEKAANNISPIISTTDETNSIAGKI